MIVPKARIEFADLCNERGYARVVEIGTDQAVYASEFLRRWSVPGGWFYAVDNYGDHPGVYTPRLADSMMAVINLAPFAGRVRMFGECSIRAAEILREWNWRPNFVYLDGDHSYASVRDDIAAWWPLIPSGGVLAGHDYSIDPQMGVIQAVDEFVASVELPMGLTNEASRSWWVEKP